ncbi:MAG: hypothetical protein KGY80_06285 [Candidatus Thorarchaeota archaeon]|nr:hypothetical protein [Candidatus Thorarchaeota archaeon]
MARLHNQTPLVLCVIGGALILLSGSSGTIGFIGGLAGGWDEVLGPNGTLTLEIMAGLLAIFTVVGGLGIIATGFVLTTKHVRKARTGIAFFIAMTISGLVVTLANLTLSGRFAMGLMFQFMQSLGWLGAILAVVARTIAEQKPILDPSA